MVEMERAGRICQNARELTCMTAARKLAVTIMDLVFLSLQKTLTFL